MPSHFKLFLEYSAFLICDAMSSQIPLAFFGFPKILYKFFFPKLNFTKFLRPHVVANNFGTFWKPNCLHNLLGKLNLFISHVIVTTCHRNYVLGNCQIFPLHFLRKLNAKLLAMTCHCNYDTPIEF